MAPSELPDPEHGAVSVWQPPKAPPCAVAPQVVQYSKVLYCTATPNIRFLHPGSILGYSIINDIPGLTFVLVTWYSASCLLHL